MADETPEKPYGQKLRELINPALEDERRKALQASIASDYFAKVAEAIPAKFDEELKHFFNYVSKAPEKKRNQIIIQALTAADGPEGDSAFAPIKRLPVKVSTAFTDFTAEEIREMPGWIKLHEVCRDMDIAIRLVAMTGEESKGSLMPPILIFDASKSYVDGAMENSQFYPQLQDKPAQFNRRNGQNFEF